MIEVSYKLFLALALISFYINFYSYYILFFAIIFKLLAKKIKIFLREINKSSFTQYYLKIK